jgi:formylglycine-generating enzyme required for sulfatase activity
MKESLTPKQSNTVGQIARWTKVLELAFSIYAESPTRIRSMRRSCLSWFFRFDIMMECVIAFMMLTLIATVGCVENTPRRDQSKGEEQQVATKAVLLGFEQQLDFRFVSPATFGIDYPDFYMLETEVTNAQFKAFLAATDATKDDTDVLKIVKNREKNRNLSTGDIPYKITDELAIWRNGDYPHGLHDHPVALVTLHDATNFADWLNENYGEVGVFRLPTWNEWMIVAYGKSRNYPWGNEWDKNRLHSSHGCKLSFDPRNTAATTNKPPTHTEPVKARPNGRTPQGVFGILGNVGEYIIEGDTTNDSYFNLGSRSMGGGFTDGLAILDNETDRLPPRNDYWGYSHHATAQECDIGFRLIFAPTKNDVMLKQPRLFDQNNQAWMIKKDDEAEANMSNAPHMQN